VPVAPLAPSAPTAPAGSTETAPPTAGFADLLASQASAATGGSIADLPTVTLAQMISARTAPPQVPGVPQGGLGDLDAPNRVQATSAPASPSATAAPSDAWGAAGDRPASASDGPGARVIAAGERYLGVPYKWGGTSASTGFDCSGFVQQVYADLGISLPRVSVDQSRAGSPVASLSEARPGDLVFWRGGGGRPNHIGIYAGDGKMLVAPRTGDVVRYQDITRTPDGIRRIIT
jgi:cell wall-associated NlpC family hydrolase